jgi:hypothetical protein
MLTRSQARKRLIDVPSEALPRSSQRRRRFVVEDSDGDSGYVAQRVRDRQQVAVMVLLSVTWLTALALVVAAAVVVMQHCTSAHACDTAVDTWTAAWLRTVAWASTTLRRAVASTRGFL